MTNPTLIWNAYLLPDGTVQDAPPVCPDCSFGLRAHEPSPNMLPCCETCNTCGGSGHAAHWRIVPTAGMLVLNPQDGEWYTMTADNARCAASIPEAYGIPLAPPPSAGLSLRAALALLPEAEQGNDGCVRVYYLGEEDYPIAWSQIWHDGEQWRCEFATDLAGYTDTTPLRLAIQRHDALQQYIAGWREGK